MNFFCFRADRHCAPAAKHTKNRPVRRPGPYNGASERLYPNMEPYRTERLAESLRNELGEILNYELDDPRVTGVTVTEVNLSPDNKKAHVRLAIEGNADQQAACMEAVEKAKGYIKHIVADRLDVFRLPDLYFDPDLAADVRSRVPSLLRRIRRGRARS